MQKREPLLDDQHFDRYIEGELAFTEELNGLQQSTEPDINHALVQFMQFQSTSKLMELKYSRGYSLEEIRTDFLALVDALEKYRTFPDPDDNPDSMFFNGEQDEYMQAVELVSLGLLLHVDLDIFRRLVAAIGVNGQDYVLDWLVARRLPERRPATTQLLFPKTYTRLRDAIQTPIDLQQQLLRSFLAGWYESLNTVWYNIHAHRPDAAGFTGYWCWEAAAVAYALGADDSELQAMRYYPKDLADYAFGRVKRLA